MTRATITLRGMAPADAVRRFETHRQPMVVQPLPADGETPPGWLPVLMATPRPKHKSASTIRRNTERRRAYLARPQCATSALKE